MAATIESLFGVENLKTLVRLFEGESEKGKKFTNLFRNAGIDSQRGEVVDLDNLTFGRGLAPFGLVSSPAIERPRIAIGLKKATWLEINIEKKVPLQKVIDQRYPGESVLMPSASKWLADEIKDALGQIDRSVEYVSSQVLMNESGATINSSTVPGTEIVDTLDWGLTEVNATTAWSTVSTKIDSVEIPIIRDAALAASGEDLGMAIYASGSAGAEQYLKQNSEIGDLYTGTPAGLALLNRGDFSALGPVGGIPMWERYDRGYKNSGGSFTKWIANDRILFLPPESEHSRILSMAEGYIAIPDLPQVVRMGNISGSADEATGVVAYAELTTNPFAITVRFLYRFLPVVRDPAAPVLFDPTP